MSGRFFGLWLWCTRQVGFDGGVAGAAPARSCLEFHGTFQNNATALAEGKRVSAAASEGCAGPEAVLWSMGKPQTDAAAFAEGKRVSAAAWRALHEAHRGGPELGLADACTVCLEARLAGVAAAAEAGQVRHKDTRRIRI